MPAVRLAPPVLVLWAACLSDAVAQTDSFPAQPRRGTVPCTVTRISDGDTIQCAGNVRVRLIGIDAPERDQEPFGTAAASALAAMLPTGSRAHLEADVAPRDQYGRTLAYVWLDGVMVNWRMIRDGWAVPVVVAPNVQYVDFFRAARDRARRERRGLWSVGGFACEPAAHRAGRC